jgi:hypothetical protein
LRSSFSSASTSNVFHLSLPSSCFLPLTPLQASQEVQKALALDYVASPEEQALFQLERPLDRYLEPLNTALALRTSLTMVRKEEEEGFCPLDYDPPPHHTSPLTLFTEPYTLAEP